LHGAFKAVKEVLVGRGEVDKELIGQGSLIEVGVLDGLMHSILFKTFEVFMKWLVVLGWGCDGSGGEATLRVYQFHNIPQSLVSITILECHVEADAGHDGVNNCLRLKELVNSSRHGAELIRGGKKGSISSAMDAGSSV
jgi:hypothetical protein